MLWVLELQPQSPTAPILKSGTAYADSKDIIVKMFKVKTAMRCKAFSGRTGRREDSPKFLNLITYNIDDYKPYENKFFTYPKYLDRLFILICRLTCHIRSLFTDKA